MIPFSDSVSPEYIKPFKNRELVPLICQHCKISFLKPKFRIAYALKHGKSLYCSEKCYYDWKLSQRVNKNCSECDSEVFITLSDFNQSKTKRFFCNHSCAASFNNRTRKCDRSRQPRVCQWCQNPTSGGSNHCSLSCGQLHHQSKQWDFRKQQIEADGGFKKENRYLSRKYLIEKFGHQCTLCKLTEWKNELIPLVCDHIDGNSENNLLSNLRMVCQNCNALLPTFGSKNRGNGRMSKRMQYHKDKLKYIT